MATAFSDLHLLSVLAQTRSYTQARAAPGHLQGIGQHQRIGELERAAGVPLVRRTTRIGGPDRGGPAAGDDNAAAFERIEQSFAGVRDLAGSPRGLVRVTAPVALGRQHRGAHADGFPASATPKSASSWT
jgi:DNA-binding transcriptional LysR family regulator